MEAHRTFGFMCELTPISDSIHPVGTTFPAGDLVPAFAIQATMSQHKFHTHLNDKPVVVQMGFDRPLGHVHMIGYEVGQMDDPIYTNLDQPARRF